MEKKIKHLEFIQDSIKRMSGNSFLLRGWSITLVITIFTLASHINKPIYYIVALFVTVIFLTLDSYYLYQERKFRCLYDVVRLKDENDIDFSMKLPENHCKKCTWNNSAKSSIFTLFYGITTLILLIVIFTNYLNIAITLK